MPFSRREFLETAGLSAAARASNPLSHFELRTSNLSTNGAAQAAKVDAAALRQRIEALSVFGRPAGGTFADGVSRTAYSDADVEGRRWLIAEMRGAGVQPR